MPLLGNIPQTGLLRQKRPSLLQWQQQQMQHQPSVARQMPSLLGIARGGLMGLTTDILGAPVDLATMVMRPFGYSTPPQDVVGGSDWLANKLTTPSGSAEETAARVATGLLSPDVMDIMHLTPLLMGITGKGGKAMKEIRSGEGGGLTRLYHGTDEAAFKAINDEKRMSGPVFFTPRKEIAEQYGENLIEANIPVDKLKIDLDLAGARLLNVDDANLYLDKDWDISDYIDAGYSVGVDEDVILK